MQSFPFFCFPVWLRTVYLPNRHNLDRPISFPCHIRVSLNWWKYLHKAYIGVPFIRSSQTITITAEVSLLGWRAHLGTYTVQDRWSIQGSYLHISIVELRAVRKACIHFLPLIRDRIMTDNLACMFYFNH